MQDARPPLTEVTPLRLRLGDEAVATAYVSTEFGRFKSEAGAFLLASEHERVKPSIIGSPEIVYLLGQADLMMTLRLDTFRPISELPYPNPPSHARVFNWVFSVPLAGPKKRSLASLPLRFNLHLRLRRNMYATQPVENDRRLCEHLVETLDGFGLDAEIALGLGWSDYILNGGIRPEQFQNFEKAVVAIHETYAEVDDMQVPLLQRTLTLLGYHPQANPPAFAGLQPVIFGRALPGRLADIRDALSRLGVVPASVHIIDGKADLVIVPEPTSPDFLKAHQAFCETPAPMRTSAKGTAKALEDPIQRLETHLLYLPTKLENATEISRVSGVQLPVRGKDRGSCRCRERLQGVRRIAHNHEVFPPELQAAIANIRLLFNASIRDRTGCCDISFAVHACERALVNHAKRLWNRRFDLRSANGTAREIEMHTNLVDEKKQVEIWSLLSERLLRQRTVGSFEELLGQTDRAIAYRGGIQKFLVLADALMNDFSRLVTDNLYEGAGREAPMFASLYDAVSSIRSHRGTGLVLIPVKHLFRLPLIVPDLWHEVGTTLFFMNSEFFFSELADAVTAHDQFEVVVLYRDLADMFADIIVFLYGFRADFTQFEISLVRGWIEANREHENNPGVYTQHYKQLLIRLFAVFELRRKEPTAHPSLAELKFMVSEIDEHVRGSFTIFRADHEKAVADAVAFIDSPLYSWIRGKIIWPFLNAKVPQDPWGSVPEAILAGEVSSLHHDADLNALFAQFYRHREALQQRPTDPRTVEQTRRRRRTHLFRAMAALVRTTTIEYLRRYNSAS